MRRVLVSALGILLLLLAIGFVLVRLPGVQDRIVSGVADRLVTATRTDLLEEDALRVLLCGSASPFPHATRARPCVAVFAAGRFWVVDTGPGSWNNFGLWRIPGDRIGAVLLTHFHSDHIGELGEYDLQTWVAGRDGPLRVFGPPGVERVVAGFEEAYALDTGYRIAHHGSELLSEEKARMQAKPIAARGASALVLEEDGLRITMFTVEHPPIVPSVGYRFDYGGRSVVVSGDTKKSQTVVEAAKGADVLVHEAQANHIVSILQQAAAGAGRASIAKVLSDIPDYHTTPVEAAEVANDAGVPLVVFYHLTPPPPTGLVERIFTRGVDEARDGDWILGDDGLLVELPKNSDAIEISQLD